MKLAGQCRETLTETENDADNCELANYTGRLPYVFKTKAKLVCAPAAMQRTFE